MELRRIYTSPVNHHNLDAWPALAARLASAVRASAPGLSVETSSKPVFGYGGDAYDALEAEQQLAVSSRHVRVDLWSSVVLYETICITFGSGVTEREARAVTRRLESNELAEQTFVREVEDVYDLDAGRVYGYVFDRDDDAKVIDWLLMPLDPPIYVAPRGWVLDETGAVDPAFDVMRDEAGVAVFTAEDKDAEKRLWSWALGSESEGLLAVYAADEAEDLLVERFSDLDDLRILIAEKPSAGMRVTVGRCHADDSLVVVYTPPWAPEIDPPLLFVI